MPLLADGLLARMVAQEAGLAQAPLEHWSVAAHFLAQPPQLLLSLNGSTHLEPQHSLPSPHAPPHLPQL